MESSLDSDESLRQAALERLGALAPPLSVEALECGVVEVEPAVLVWEGSMGTVHAHRVRLWLDPELCRRLEDAHSAVDALTAAIASALADEPGRSLAELEIRPRAGMRRRSTAYRGDVP